MSPTAETTEKLDKSETFQPPVLAHTVVAPPDPLPKTSSYHYLDPEVRRFRFNIGGNKHTTIKMQTNQTFTIKNRRDFEFINRIMKKGASQ